MKKKHNILLVAITRLGDMLQMSPTITGLKAEHPDARITVVIDRQFAAICSGIPGIDEVYVLDLNFLVRSIHQERHGIVEAYEYISGAVDDLKACEFDYCLNMSNSAYTALLIKMLDVEDNRGWLSDDEGFRIMADPWAMLFAAFVYHSNRDFNSLNLVDIFRSAADVRKHPRSLQYNVPNESKDFAEQFLQEHGLEGEGPLICVQAGASQEKRQWELERFTELLRLLIEKQNARVIFTGAPEDEAIINAIIEKFPHPRAVSAVGKTNFDQLAGLLERADVMITGDTGPMHLSVAVGTPVVALFLASALCYETGPYSAGNFVLQPQINCNPCNPNYPCSRPDCHDQISPQLVAYLTELRYKTPVGQEHTLKISQEIADPRQVAVLYSCFDDDGFLDFKAMNGFVSRHGQPRGYYENAKDAYRALWKDEFSGIRTPAIEQGLRDQIEVAHPSLEGVQKIVDFSRQGQALLQRLELLVRDVNSPPQSLTETSMQLKALDGAIEEVSLAYPIIGAIIRIFIMEKENIRGDDAMKLIEDTSQLYESLGRRCARFGQFFGFFHETRGAAQ